MLWLNFILGLSFIFFFGGMVMYGNEFETKESKIQTKDKIEPQHKHAEGRIFRSGITAISFPSSTSHSFLPNAFLFWAFFWASFLGIKCFHNDLNGKKLHFILNMKLLVSSFAAAQAEVKQCCLPSAWQGDYKVTGLK